MATLADLRARTRRLSGVDMTDLFSNSDVDVEINDAYFTLLEHREWRFMDTTATFDTVADQRSYSLPSGITRIHGLQIASGSNRGDLRPRSESALAERGADTYADESGVPLEYVFDRPDMISLYPLPDAVYTITVEGRGTYTELSGDSDEPIFDERYHRVLAYLAASQILDQEGDDSGRSERYSEVANGIIRSLVEEDQVDHDRSPIQMGARRDRRRGLRYYTPYRWW